MKREGLYVVAMLVLFMFLWACTGSMQTVSKSTVKSIDSDLGQMRNTSENPPAAVPPKVEVVPVPTEPVQEDKKETAPETPKVLKFKMNQQVPVDYINWTVTKAEESVKLQSIFDIKTTEGKFIHLFLSAKNAGRVPAQIMDSDFLMIIDSEGRIFEPYTEQYMYVTSDTNILFSKIQPGMSKSFETIFELPADATGLLLYIKGDVDTDTRKYVELSTTKVTVSGAGSHCAAPAHCTSGECDSWNVLGRKDCAMGQICCDG